MRRILVVLVALAVVFAFAIVPAYAQNTFTIQLAPLPGQVGSGTATFTDMGAQTQVVVSVTGLAPGVHANHIHTGTCGASGPIVFPLTDLTVDSTGAGTATSMVPASLATIQASQHVLNVHAGPEASFPTQICGAIPVVAGVSAVAPAAAGGPDGSMLASIATGLGAMLAGCGLWLRRRAGR